MSVNGINGPCSAKTSVESRRDDGDSDLRFGPNGHEIEWCRTLDSFEILSVLGEGTFGRVLRARDKTSGEVFALKRIKEDNGFDGVPVNALREITLLQRINSKVMVANVVRLKGIITEYKSTYGAKKGCIFLVFEYMEHDLSGLIELRYESMFGHSVIKCFLKQLISGLYELHQLVNVIHRDIKTSNLLVNRGVLKIADFGLAREVRKDDLIKFKHSDQRYTSNVITLWYRPPELLMTQGKASIYSMSVDMWSVGCVFAEMLFKRPLFKGQTNIELLEEMFQILGTPTVSNARELLSLEGWKDFVPKAVFPSKLADMCRDLPNGVYELLSSLLNYNPNERISAEEALNSEYFWVDPLPCEPHEVPECQQANEYLAKLAKSKFTSNPNPTFTINQSHNHKHHHHHQQQQHYNRQYYHRFHENFNNIQYNAYYHHKQQYNVITTSSNHNEYPVKKITKKNPPPPPTTPPTTPPPPPPPPSPINSSTHPPQKKQPLQQPSYSLVPDDEKISFQPENMDVVHSSSPYEINLNIHHHHHHHQYPDNNNAPIPPPSLVPPPKLAKFTSSNHYPLT